MYYFLFIRGKNVTSFIGRTENIYVFMTYVHHFHLDRKFRKANQQALYQFKFSRAFFAAHIDINQNNTRLTKCKHCVKK